MASDEQLPREVSRGTLNIMGREIEVVHLDNGQRIVTEESLLRFLGLVEPEPPCPVCGCAAEGFIVHPNGTSSPCPACSSTPKEGE